MAESVYENSFKVLAAGYQLSVKELGSGIFGKNGLYSLDSLVPFCLASEIYYLTRDERRRFLKKSLLF